MLTAKRVAGTIVLSIALIDQSQMPEIRIMQA